MSSTPDPSATPQATTDNLTILCPFCNGKVETEMYNGTYGCDTGCDYIRFEVRCPGCHRGIYSTGCFGEFAETEKDDYNRSRESYYSDFMEDFAEAVQRIHQRRLADEEEAKAKAQANADGK